MVHGPFCRTSNDGETQAANRIVHGQAREVVVGTEIADLKIEKELLLKWLARARKKTVEHYQAQLNARLIEEKMRRRDDELSGLDLSDIELPLHSDSDHDDFD